MRAARERPHLAAKRVPRTRPSSPGPTRTATRPSTSCSCRPTPPDEVLERRARLDLDRLLPPAEDPGAGSSLQAHAVPFDSQPRALAQADDMRVVLLMELPDPLLARLADVARRRVRVEVVSVDLEWHQPEGFEPLRLHDRHVVGGLERGGRDDRAGART